MKTSRSRPSLKSSERNTREAADKLSTAHKKPKKVEFQTFYPVDEAESRYQTSLDDLFKIFPLFLKNFNQSSHECINDFLSTTYYLLKYEPTVRVGYQPFSHEDTVTSRVNSKLEEIIANQEMVLEKLYALSEQCNQQRLSRFSATSQNLDLSVSLGESVIDEAYHFSDLVDYVMEFMKTSNRLLDLVANIEAQVDDVANDGGDFTVYEELLNCSK
ncbi:Uncharacterized protein QTN25_002248 [Entamoeba marina]